MGKKLTDAKREAIRRYDAKATRQIHLKLNINTDADILEHLGKQDSIQGYIKRLIREDMDAQITRDWYALKCSDALEKLNGISIPLQHGYRDEDAIRNCVENEHTIYVHRMEQWEIRFDLDDRKVLTVIDMRIGKQ